MKPTSTMRPTAIYATTYLICWLLLSHICTSTAFLSSFADMAKGAVGSMAKAVGLSPSTTLSPDPKIALKQLPSILKQYNLGGCEVDLNKVLNSEEGTKIYDQVEREMRNKLSKRTVPLI